MMRLGVIADTHMDRPNARLKQLADSVFDGVDMILHAGDLHALAVLEAFPGKEIVAVAGNRDRPEVTAALPNQQVIRPAGHPLGIIHGWGPPWGLPRRVSVAFKDVECVVFGHSHHPFNKVRNGILLFNPGSFCRGISSLGRSSVGILTVEKDGIKGRIIRF